MLDPIDLTLLKRIPTHPHRASTPELARELRACGHDLGARAVQKRLAALRDAHDLVCHDANKPHQWSWPKGAKQKVFPKMAPYEALSLLLAREHLRLILPPKTLAWIEERLAQTETEVQEDQSGNVTKWCSKVRRMPHDIPRVVPTIDTRVFKNVSEALFEGLQLDLSYRKRYVQAPQEYRVHPLGLVERDGELWLAARKVDDTESPEIRFFLLHRMAQASVLRGRPAIAPAGFDLDAELARGVAHFPLSLGPAMNFTARFSTMVVEKLEQSPLSRDQTLKPVEDGWVRLTATVPHTRALHAFILGYGPLCVVESPETFRESIAKDLKQALAGYRK